MRQTLIRIPLDGPWSLGPLGEIPGFGFGVVLAVWVLCGAVWLFRSRRDLSLGAETLIPIGFWALIAVVIVSIPRVVQMGSQRTIAAVSAALENGPPAAALYLNRGDAYKKTRQYPKARDDYQTAVRLDGQDPQAHARLAWLLAACPDSDVRDGRAAVEHARRACELAKPAATYYPLCLDILAAALAETGEFEEASSSAQQAAELAGSSADPYVRSHLPEIRARLGHFAVGRPYRDRSAGVSVPLYGYGLMFVLGLFAGGWTATWRARQIGIESDVIWDLLIWMAFLGLAGARLFYCVQKYDQVFYRPTADGMVLKGPLELLRAAVYLPEGGLVLYGGLLAGIATFFVFCRRRKLPAIRVADALIPSVFLGLAFGRIGCFLNGCCYGGRCELPWGVTFPLGSVPDIALIRENLLPPGTLDVWRLHPAQLYSALNALVLAGVTHWYFKQRPRAGSVLAVGWLAYPVTRFLLEYIRIDEKSIVLTTPWGPQSGDAAWSVTTPFTISQWVSLVVFALGLVYVYWWSRQPSAVESTQSPPGKVATPVRAR